MNVLGGYQKINLSTADLTAPTLSVEGLSKACGNANGKAVLVKMPDGTEAFGAVKETQSGYQLSVMGADSKVSRLDVDDADDTFTMQTGAETSDLGGNITGGTKTPVTLTTDNSVANPYIVPADGYIRIENTVTSVDTTTAVAIPYSDRTNALPLFWSIPAANSTKARREAFFVKRGTPIAVAAKATNTNVVFIALETEE